MNDFDDIVNSQANIEQICKYVVDHNIDKKSIIENSKFKEKLYQELGENNFSYSCIRNVIETFGIDECMKNIDIDRVKDLNSSYRYLSTLAEYDGSKEVLNKVANDEEYYDYFLKNVRECFSFIEKADCNDIKRIVDKISKEPEKFNNSNYFFKGINKESKEKLLKEDLDYDTVEKIVISATQDIQQKFITDDPRAFNMCKDFDV